MKISRYQIIADEMTENLQWRWTALLWLSLGPIADIAVKSLSYYSTEAICIEEAKKLLTELGIEIEVKTMNKNSKQRKAANPGAHQPRKRRIAKERS